MFEVTGGVGASRGMGLQIFMGLLVLSPAGYAPLWVYWRWLFWPVHGGVNWVFSSAQFLAMWGGGCK